MTVLQSTAARGFATTFSAFLIWGLLPMYLKALSAVTPLEVVLHRAIWACVFIVIWLALNRSVSSVKDALADPATRWRLVLSALLISSNWLLYVWAVNTSHVIETSLGYFINPLLNVMLGVLVLRERLNSIQWIAVSIAALGVAYITWDSGRLPWIALALAASFGLYGLIRKTVRVDAVAGLAGETLLLLPLAVLVLGRIEASGAGTHFGWQTFLLLLAGGPITAIPLALFAYGARLISYSTVGLIQYVAPTLQLILGVAVFGEPFTPTLMIGFGAIWFALAIYAVDGLWRARRAT